MATITSLSFVITSTYSGAGMRRARRDIDDFDISMNAMSKASKSLAPGMKDLVATVLGLGPALVPIAGGLLGIGAAASSAFVAGGAAIGIYAIALKGAIQSTVGQGSAVASTTAKLQTAQTALDNTTKGTKAYGKALKKVTQAERAHEAALKALPPVQEKFARAYDNAKVAVLDFNTANAKFTLGPATTMLEAFMAALPKMSGVLRAVQPEIQRVADLTKKWVTTGGLDRFLTFVKSYGVPALHGFVDALRLLFGALGTGMRDTAPLGAAFIAWLTKTMAAFKSWASGGGFERFLAWLAANKGALLGAVKDLGTFLANVAKSVGNMSGSAFTVFGVLLKVLASFPPGLLTAMAYGFIAITAAMKIYAAIMLIVAINSAIAAFATGTLSVVLIAVVVQVLLIVAALALLAVGIYFLVKYWDTVWAAIKTAAQAVWGWLVTAWNATWNAIKAAAVAVWNFLTTGWGQFLLLLMGPIGLLIFLAAHWEQIWGTIKSVALTVWDALKAAWSATVGGLLTAWRAVIAPITDTWNKVWPQLHEAATNIWHALSVAWAFVWTQVQAVWTVFWSVFGPSFKAAWAAAVVVATGAWETLKAAWALVWTVIQSVFNVAWAILRGAWSVAWSALTGIAQVAWSVLQGAWRVLWSVVTGIWNTFYAAFAAVFSGAWSVISAIATGVWNVIKAAWSALWAVVTAVFTTFFAIFTGNWGQAWASISAAAQAVWNLLRTAWQAFLTVIQTVLAAFAGVFVATWQAFWTAVQTTASTFWTALQAVFRTFLTAVEALWDTTWAALRTVFQAFLTAVQASASAAWNAIRTGVAAFLAGVQAVWSAVWTAVRAVFQVFLTVVQAAAAVAWLAIRAGVSAFLTAVQTVWSTIWTAIRTAFTAVLAALQTAASAAWTAFRSGVVAFLTAVRDFWAAVWTAIRTGFQTALNAIVAAATAFWTAIRSAFSAGSTWLRETFWGPVNTLFTKTIPDAFSAGAKALGKAWDAVRKLVRDPIQAVVNVVYNNGIVKLWNAVAGVFGAKKLDAFTLPAFKQGGPTGSGSADGFPALVHPGEHVWTKDEVRGAGGHGAVAALRSQAMGGAKVRAMGDSDHAFKDGGGIFGTGLGPDAGPDLVPDGIIKDIGHGISGAVGKLKDLALGAVSGPFGAAVDAVAKVGKSAVRAAVPGTDLPLEQLGVGMIDQIAETVKSWVSDHDVAPDIGGNGFAPWAKWKEGDGTHVNYRGVTVNRRTAAMLDNAAKIAKTTLSMFQGSYSRSVGASAGTHDGGGAADVGPAKDSIVGAMRASGFAAWRRTPAEGFSPHVHGIAVGDPTVSSAAAAQIKAFNAGRNGLVDNGPDTYGGGGGTSGKSVSAAKATGKSMNAARGWSSHWSALEALWSRESGWRWNADNPSSDAYGIPQALPGSTMKSAGADWKTNPATQIKWGLGYIASRYGNPGKANSFQKAHNWYGLGTPGAARGPAVVGEHEPEILNLRGGERIDPLSDLIGRGGGDTNVTVTIPISGRADHGVVDRLERETIPKLTMAIKQGVGRRT